MISLKQNQPNENLDRRIVTFTRRDVTPQAIAPVFTNDSFSPISLECMQDNENESFQMCQFTDAYQQKITVKHISFINHQVANPMVTSFKRPNGSLITRMDFKEPVDCEFFGLNSTGLTLKCLDKNKIRSVPPSGGSLP